MTGMYAIRPGRGHAAALVRARGLERPDIALRAPIVGLAGGLAKPPFTH